MLSEQCGVSKVIANESELNLEKMCEMWLRGGVDGGSEATGSYI